jgi:hypothetical protein
MLCGAMLDIGQASATSAQGESATLATVIQGISTKIATAALTPPPNSGAPTAYEMWAKFNAASKRVLQREAAGNSDQLPNCLARSTALKATNVRFPQAGFVS